LTSLSESLIKFFYFFLKIFHKTLMNTSNFSNKAMFNFDNVVFMFFITFFGGAGVSAFLGVFLSLSPDLRNWVLTQIFQVFVRPFNAASWFFAQPRSCLAAPSREPAESSLGFGRQILDLLKKFGAEFLELCAKEFRRSSEKK